MADSITTSGTITAIGTVGIPTPDHELALEFYSGVLGFEKRIDAEFGPGLRWVEVAPPGALTSVALAPVQPGGPVGIDTGIRLSTADADATHADLLARGVDVDPEVLRFGPTVPPMFTLRDPAGNTLYVVQRV